MIYDYSREHPGLILRVGGGGECRVWVPEMVSNRNPYVAIVRKWMPKDDGRQPPSLVAKVISKGSEVRDDQTKREEYLTSGVREYWIIDPSEGKVIVSIRQDVPGPPAPAWAERVFRGDEAIISPMLPGFTGTVAEL